MTCKQRRVKCDEAKPECRVCQRLKLRCGGYLTKYARLKFRDQNCKFRNDRSVAVQEQVPVPRLRRLSEPDTAVPFFLGHYVRLGRDMGSTRGFFEMLIPAYFSQPQDSALSLALTALASEVLSLWRHDAGSFRAPRNAYCRAITRLRCATQDHRQRGKMATVLAALVLQIYENAAAIYGCRLATSTHLNGAASLLSFVDSDDMDGAVGAYVRKFMLHTEVSSAVRQKKPLQHTMYSWMASKDMMAVPHNPSSALDAIGASVAELQASYTQLVMQESTIPSPKRVLKELRAEAKRVDEDLLAWVRSVPDHWRPLRLTSGQDIDPLIPTYRSVCEVYPSCQISSIWNFWRFQRLILVKTALGSLNAFSDLGQFGLAYDQFLGEPGYFVNYKQTFQEVVDSVCYSIPFHLGNRTGWSSITDFTDPMILLPTDCSLVSENQIELNKQSCDPGMSKQDHRRHIIAQGPWRSMSPLSSLLTFFSEDHGRVMAGLLRPGQYEWICKQFLRVATLLRLPTELTDERMGRNSLASESVNARAEHLAREVRKGAILMSGP